VDFALTAANPAYAYLDYLPLAAAVAPQSGVVRRRLIEPDISRLIGLVTRRNRAFHRLPRRRLACCAKRWCDWLPSLRRCQKNTKLLHLASKVGKGE